MFALKIDSGLANILNAVLVCSGFKNGNKMLPEFFNRIGSRQKKQTIWYVFQPLVWRQHRVLNLYNYVLVLQVMLKPFFLLTGLKKSWRICTLSTKVQFSKYTPVEAYILCARFKKTKLKFVATIVLTAHGQKDVRYLYHNSNQTRDHRPK